MSGSHDISVILTEWLLLELSLLITDSAFSGRSLWSRVENFVWSGLKQFFAAKDLRFLISSIQTVDAPARSPCWWASGRPSVLTRLLDRATRCVQWGTSAESRAQHICRAALQVVADELFPSRRPGSAIRPTAHGAWASIVIWSLLWRESHSWQVASVGPTYCP